MGKARGDPKACSSQVTFKRVTPPFEPAYNFYVVCVLRVHTVLIVFDLGVPSSTLLVSAPKRIQQHKWIGECSHQMIGSIHLFPITFYVFTLVIVFLEVSCVVCVCHIGIFILCNRACNYKVLFWLFLI